MMPAISSVLDTRTLDTLLGVADPPPQLQKVQTYWREVIEQMPVIEPGTPAKDGLQQPIPGSRFVKRLIVHRDTIYVGEQPVRQVERSDATNVTQLIASFERKGFSPTESGEGLIVVRIPKTDLARTASMQSKEFKLNAGFHRHAAQSDLAQKTGIQNNKWEWFIVDEYAYDTPLAELVHAAATNCHWIAKSPALQNDIYYTIERAIEDKMLARVQPEIERFVDQIAGHMTEKQRRQYVRDAISKAPFVGANGRQVRSLLPRVKKADRASNPRSAHYWAHKMNLPIDDYDNSYGDLGSYVSDEGSISKCVTDGMQKWANAGFPADRKVFAVFYVNTADLAKHKGSFTPLRDTREKHWKKAQADMQVQYDVLLQLFKNTMQAVGVKTFVPDADLRDAIVKTHPVMLAGFLPQETSPDNRKGGSPSEATMVDVDGRPWDIHRILGRD